MSVDHKQERHEHFLSGSTQNGAVPRLVKRIWDGLSGLGVFLLYGCLLGGGYLFIRDGLFPEILYATSPEDYGPTIDAYVTILLIGLIGLSTRSYFSGKRKLKTGR